MFEAYSSTEWPGLGYMWVHNATTLWESWGVVESSVSGRPLSEGVCRTDDAVLSAGWLAGECACVSARMRECMGERERERERERVSE